MTVPNRTAKARRGSRRSGWALLTALLILAIGSGIALVFTDKAIYLRIGLLLALWAAVIASFAALTYRRQSDADQIKVRDQKLVYDLQLEREISARREYELTVESRLRQQLAAEIEAQAADEIATLRAELAALRTNLEILFNTDLSERPAIEHDPIRALGPWPGAEPEYDESASAHASPGFTESVREPVPEPDSAAAPAAEFEEGPSYGGATYDDLAYEESRTTEYPIIDVSEDPHHGEGPPPPVYRTAADTQYEAAQFEAGPYGPAQYGAVGPHEPEPYQQPASSGAHWRPEPEPHLAPGIPEYLRQTPETEVIPESVSWTSTPEQWDAAADGEDWDPIPQQMAPPEQPVSPWSPPPASWDSPGLQPWEVPHAVQEPPAAEPSAPVQPWEVPEASGWNPAPAEGQWLPPGSQGSNWSAGPPPEPPTFETAGRHSGTPSRHQAAAESGVDSPVGGHWAAEPSADLPPAQERRGGHRAAESDEAGGRRRAEETGGFSVSDLLGRLQDESASSRAGRRHRRED